jgi:hypothetical protein
MPNLFNSDKLQEMCICKCIDEGGEQHTTQLSYMVAGPAQRTSTSPAPMASPKVQLLGPSRIAIFWSQ